MGKTNINLIIPDEDMLYYGVHRNLLLQNNQEYPKPTDDVPYHIFRSNKGSMSTNWKEYSTNWDLKLYLENLNGQNGSYSVVDLVTGKLRSINMIVNHSPSKDNYAHTDVKGLEGLEKARKNTLKRLIARDASWSIINQVEIIFD